ncbi:hypothetical protein [Micromonospora nigra]|nr:hypothetical protein [Micromonospora nigra]
MGPVGRTVAALAAVAGGTAVTAVLARRRVARRRSGGHAGTGRWQVVTVGGPPGRVLPGGGWPEPLRPLHGAVAVRVRPAPGGRGTELAARALPGRTPAGLAAHLVGDDPALLVRRALREVKQLAETGEVLRADRSPAERPTTPPG